MSKSNLSAITEQEFLTWRQLLATCLTVIFFIQLIPFFVTPTPYMEWMLLGFTAAVSTCAVVGAVLVQYNADKVARLYKSVFNADFYETIGLFTQMRQIVLTEAHENNRNVEEELADIIPKAYAFFRAYLDKENVEPPSIEDLGVAPAPEIEDETELFA
tara:strand:+ start:1585 stop:2061 length:477 start_codon:yes stop_codon:yes gene_type:complete